MRNVVVGLPRAAVLVGTAGALVGAALDRRGPGVWLDGDDLAGLRTIGVLLLVGGALLTLAAPVRVRAVGGMVAAAGLAPFGIATTEALRTGLPGPSTAVLAVGSAVAVAGVLARVLGPRGGTPGPVIVMVVALLTAAVAVPAAVLVDDLAVRSSPAAPVAAAPVPDRLTAVRWTWATGEDVRDVRAAGPGVVVATDLGVVALDGSTGADRWRFDRTGATVTALAVSPDGETVVVAHSAPGAEASVLTVLDATTGTRRWDVPLAGERGEALLTSTVVALAVPLRNDDGDPADRLVARDLVTGATRWTWDPPDGCTHVVLRAQSVRGVVPAETLCAGVTVLRGLDETDGVQRWAAELSRPSAAGERQGPGLPPWSAPDGSVLVVSTDTGYATLDPATGRLLVDLPPGFPAYRGPGRVGLVDGSPERLVTAVDPRTGVATPVPPGCPDELTGAVVAGSVVRICRTDRLEAQVDGTALPGSDLGRLFRNRGVALDPLREEFVVPGPGAVVVAVADVAGTVVGLG